MRLDLRGLSGDSGWVTEDTIFKIVGVYRGMLFTHGLWLVIVTGVASVGCVRLGVAGDTGVFSLPAVVERKGVQGELGGNPGGGGMATLARFAKQPQVDAWISMTAYAGTRGSGIHLFGMTSLTAQGAVCAVEYVKGIVIELSKTIMPIVAR